MDRKAADTALKISSVQSCPECGSIAVATEFQRQQFPYGEGNRAVQLEALLPVRRCSECGFEYLDDAAEEIRHEAVCRHLGVLTPHEIRELREQYGLSRMAFSRLTHLGEATLNRWETGALIQNHAYDRLLRLLRFPENVRRLDPSTFSASKSEPRKGSSVVSYKFRALKVDLGFREEQRTFRLHKRVA